MLRRKPGRNSCLSCMGVNSRIGLLIGQIRSSSGGMLIIYDLDVLSCSLIAWCSRYPDIYIPAHSMLNVFASEPCSAPPKRNPFFTPVPSRPPETISIRSISSSHPADVARK